MKYPNNALRHHLADLSIYRYIYICMHLFIEIYINIDIDLKECQRNK